MKSISGNQESNVFVTVGTTQFDKLVASVTSKMALEWMVSRGYKSLTIQYGTGQKPETDATFMTMAIRAYDFQPSLDADMRRADLIISHAGAGTVTEALRLQKKLVVVINTLLMNNHQEELAGAMAERGHLLMVEKPEELDDSETWKSFQKFSQIPHKSGDENDFPRLLDFHLGFQSSKND
jgi:beta-1,4-N-acetylglucosaminyltransferase